MNEPSFQHRAVLARDAGLARLRRLTRFAVAGALALSGIFAAVAAGSTHPRKVVQRGLLRARRASTSQGVVTETQQPATTASSSDEGQAPTVTPAGPAPAPPTQAPTPTTSPPVVVSGGS